MSSKVEVKTATKKDVLKTRVVNTNTPNRLGQLIVVDVNKKAKSYIKKQ